MMTTNAILYVANHLTRKDFHKIFKVLYFAVQNWMIVVPKQEANADYLSESDLEELNNSLSLYGSLSWDEVREKSHDFAWRSTVKDHTIDLQNILRENGEVEEYINFITEHINLQKVCL